VKSKGRLTERLHTQSLSRYHKPGTNLQRPRCLTALLHPFTTIPRTNRRTDRLHLSVTTLKGFTVKTATTQS